MNSAPGQQLYIQSRRHWTAAEFERAGESGIFGAEERLELIEGEIVRKMTPQHSEHAGAVRCVEEALRTAFAAGHDVRVQFPLALSEASEPEPDVAVVTGSHRDYMHHHPRTAVLVVEVSDSTLRFDRTTKASLYAQAGIPEYWIVNLVDRVLEVHRDPAAMAEQPLGHAYGNVTRFRECDPIAPLAAPQARIPVSSLLP